MEQRKGGNTNSEIGPTQTTGGGQKKQQEGGQTLTRVCKGLAQAKSCVMGLAAPSYPSVVVVQVAPEFIPDEMMKWTEIGFSLLPWSYAVAVLVQ